MSAPQVRRVCQGCGVLCKHSHCLALEKVLEMESEPNCPQIQEIEVESRLFLGPQVTHSVMERAAPIRSGGIHVQQEIQTRPRDP